MLVSFRLSQMFLSQEANTRQFISWRTPDDPRRIYDFLVDELRLLALSRHFQNSRLILFGPAGLVGAHGLIHKVSGSLNVTLRGENLPAHSETRCFESRAVHSREQIHN